jgi:hypothetical protein
MILIVLISLSFSVRISVAHNTDQAYIERRTLFNKITDNIAVIGKSRQEKIIIKRARWLARRKARLRKIRGKKWLR